MHENNISDICDILIASNAVTCTIESYEPVHNLYDNKALYHIPYGYYVKVDYNKLAKAIYEAGYRKLKGGNNV